MNVSKVRRFYKVSTRYKTWPKQDWLWIRAFEWKGENNERHVPDWSNYSIFLRSCLMSYDQTKSEMKNTVQRSKKLLSGLSSQDTVVAFYKPSSLCCWKSFTFFTAGCQCENALSLWRLTQVSLQIQSWTLTVMSIAKVGSDKIQSVREILYACKCAQLKKKGNVATNAIANASEVFQW